ncbi:MAG: response regulator [Alphaproteobacteria bacterium]|nr:response regulator [Alphaproteobacteria bacterium]
MDILVGDDNAFILEMIRNILGAENYTIHACNNVDDALNEVDERAFDLVITDIVMPVRSGVDFIREMKRRGVGTPILAITGGVENAIEDYVNYADLYADETLAKPFKHREFIDMVERLASRSPQ